MRDDKITAYAGAVAFAIGIALPLLLAVPLGWLWLWERGWTLYYIGAALGISAIAFGVRLWVTRRLRRELADGAAAADPSAVLRAPREQAAKQAVEAIAAKVEPGKLASRDAILALGVETVEAVARQMHPGEQDPVWKFTVPEALVLVERVSQRLRPLFVESIPLGDRLTIGQVIKLYGWRGYIDVAEKAYDIWRLVRLVNPVAAATSEIRERLNKAAFEGIREEAAKRLAAAFVREVGEAAIELYSGRLRLVGEELAARVSAETKADREEGAKAVAEPLRLLVAGQTSAGKSSLVNALAAEVKAAVDALPATRTFAGYEISRAGLPPVMVVDSPGLMTAQDRGPLAQEADDCDLLLWVVAANRADREADRAGIAAIRATFAERPHRRAPPIVVVLTHIDRLRPLSEWSPPYDVADPKTPKARAIRDAMEAVAGDLGVPLSHVVPVCLAAGAVPVNIDLVWARVMEELPAAKSAQLLRLIEDAAPKLDWKRLAGQAAGAGRLIMGAWTRGKGPKAG